MCDLCVTADGVRAAVRCNEVIFVLRLLLATFGCLLAVCCLLTAACCLPLAAMQCRPATTCNEVLFVLCHSAATDQRSHGRETMNHK